MRYRRRVLIQNELRSWFVSGSWCGGLISAWLKGYADAAFKLGIGVELRICRDWPVWSGSGELDGGLRFMIGYCCSPMSEIAVFVSILFD